MSLASPVLTSLAIIMRKADIEYRLMQITNTIQHLTLQASEEASTMLASYQKSVAASEGTDDESTVAADVMNSSTFNASYQSLMLQVQAKEKQLEAEKTQLESEENELDTMQDGVDKMIESGINDFKYCQS